MPKTTKEIIDEYYDYEIEANQIIHDTESLDEFNKKLWFSVDEIEKLQQNINDVISHNVHACDERYEFALKKQFNEVFSDFLSCTSKDVPNGDDGKISNNSIAKSNILSSDGVQDNKYRLSDEEYKKKNNIKDSDGVQDNKCLKCNHKNSLHYANKNQDISCHVWIDGTQCSCKG